MKIFDESLFCGKVFNDAINLSFDAFIEKYEAESKSMKKDSVYETIDFILDDSTKIRALYNTSNKVSACQCWFTEPTKIEHFIKTIENNSLFEYDSFMGDFLCCSNNINELSMQQIAIHAEKTMGLYFVEVMLIY